MTFFIVVINPQSAPMYSVMTGRFAATRTGWLLCLCLRVQNFESDASERADGDTSGGFMNQSILSSEGFRDRTC
ncbi:hypothetical protein M0657_009133 [Pyricularia oryzae]|nr:hypothetical protein M9X92_008963 [Pyricularia oryzae]KAI7915302.1 hypothetical protein M0657_009133 [Pyricularia oryzae]